MSQSMKALSAILNEGISVTEAMHRFGISRAAISKAKHHPSKKVQSAQTIERLQARVAELEAQSDPEALHIAYLQGQATANETTRKQADCIATLTRQRDLAVEALTEIRTFPRHRMPADIANEALSTIKESEGK